MSVANTSRHLQELRSARLVEVRREGPYGHYRLADERVFGLWRAIRELGEARLAEIDRLVRAYLKYRESLEPVRAEELLERMRKGNVLVHPQRGLCAMGYSCLHETSNLCPGTVRRGARTSRSGAAFQRRLRDAPMPDTYGKLPRREPAEDRPESGMRFANGSQRHPCFQRARARRPHARLLLPQAGVRCLRRTERRVPAGDAPPLAEGVRAPLEPLDPYDGRRGRLRRRDHERARLRGDHPGHLVAPAGGSMDAGEAVDHFPRPLVREKKDGATD